MLQILSFSSRFRRFEMHIFSIIRSPPRIFFISTGPCYIIWTYRNKRISDIFRIIITKNVMLRRSHRRCSLKKFCKFHKKTLASESLFEVSVKNQRNIWILFKLFEKWLTYKIRRFWMVFNFFWFCLIRLQAWRSATFLKRDSNTYFKEHLRTTASEWISFKNKKEQRAVSGEALVQSQQLRH